MKPQFLIALLYAEATIQVLEQKNLQLSEHAAGHDRLRAAHEQLKARANAMESRIRDDGSALEWNLQQRTGLELEVRQLKEQVRVLSQPDDYAALERAHDELRELHLDLGRQNIALAAQVEAAEFVEQQLAAADTRIRELEAVLVLANLPAGSRDNVIQMVQEAA